MCELCGLAKSRVFPIAVSRPFVQIWIATADVANIALEVLHVYSIEANDGRIQPHICLCGVLAVVVWAAGLRNVLLGTIEGCEKGLDGFLIGFLCAAEMISSSTCYL